MEPSTCWVCCKPYRFVAVGECGHNDMCLYCAAKLRLLLKDHKCPICKTEQKRILITEDHKKRLDDYPDISNHKNEQGFIFDSSEASQEFEQLTSYNCWVPSCNSKRVIRNLVQLKKHLEIDHKLKLCEVCLKSRIVFVREQKLYKFNEIGKHIELGDGQDVPPHPMCLFCKIRHYDEDELKKHIQAKHFSCGMCDNAPYMFYEEYEKLRTHFQKAHYMCPYPECQDNRFVVFKTPYDLQAHNLAFHCNREGLSKSQRQQLAAIPMAYEEKNVTNTEGVDFSSQFMMRNRPEEVKTAQPKQKQKNKKGKTGNPRVVDFKSLPNKSQRDIENDIRDALDNDELKFRGVLGMIRSFYHGDINAKGFVEKMVEAVGDRAEDLIPWVITTVRNQDKQNALNSQYIQYMNSKYSHEVEEEKKHVKKFTPKSTVSVIDYKTLPNKPAKEIIEEIKQALNNDSEKFGRFRSFTTSYNKGQITSKTLLDKFLEFLGTISGEKLFPWLITTLNSTEKQQELHSEYTKYMESKQTSAKNSKHTIQNPFTGCSSDADYIRELKDLLFKELEKNKSLERERSYYIDQVQLTQMAALIESLSEGQMRKLMFIMNFGVSEKTKQALSNMIERANDIEFNSLLDTSYEDYFLRSCDPYEMYVAYKYTEMCLAKTRGQALRNNPQLMANLEEEKKVLPKGVVREQSESPKAKQKEDKKEENKWEQVIKKPKAKAPEKSEENFPTFGAVVTEALPGPSTGWGNKKALKMPEPPKKTDVQTEYFPSFPKKVDFPSLATAPSEAQASKSKKKTQEKVSLSNAFKVYRKV
jgi:hypothetical protein